jgi:ABC-type hemin transport system ATPase subunit
VLPTFSPSNSNEAVAFVKIEGGNMLENLQKTLQNFKINSLLGPEGSG